MGRVETPIKKLLLKVSGIYHRIYQTCLIALVFIRGKGGKEIMKAEEIFIPLVPVPKGRPKFSRVGKYIHTYTPKKTQDYEKAIAKHYVEQGKGLFTGPIHIKLVFQMPIPKSFGKKKIQMVKDGLMKYDKKPDIDNLAKAVLDALNGVAYLDDSCITRLVLTKRYSEFPGITITIWEDVN